MFGKRSRRKPRSQVRHVEEHAVVAGALQLGVDRARHDVARREVRHRVVARHERRRRRAARRMPPSPRSASVIRNDLRLRVVEAGRVELEELHVRDARRPRGTPSPRRRRSRRRGWSCRGRPCRRRRSRARRARATTVFDLAGRLVEHVGAEARRWARRTWRSVSRSIAMWSASIVMRSARAATRGEQRALDLAAGRCPWRGRCGARCARPRGPASSCPSASRSNGDAELVGEAQDVLGRLAHAQLDDVAVAQPVADAQRVLDVRARSESSGSEHGGDAALRVVRCWRRSGARLVTTTTRPCSAARSAK